MPYSAIAESAHNNDKKRNKKRRKKKWIRAEGTTIHPNSSNRCAYGGRRKEQKIKGIFYKRENPRTASHNDWILSSPHGKNQIPKV